MQAFNLKEWMEAESNVIELPKKQGYATGTSEDFENLLKAVELEFTKKWNESEVQDKLLSFQKEAILGKENEKNYFLGQIKTAVSAMGKENTPYPSWYDSLSEAIFHELWGMAGMAEWFSAEYRNSTSAKIIGNRIYFLTKEGMKLMPQTISAERREQLIRALLLANPKEKAGKNHYEIYMADGTRVTVFKNALVKGGQDVIIFRRYVIQNFSLAELARIGMMNAQQYQAVMKMATSGKNVAIVGELRSGKTTFLSAMLKAENPNLEGVLIETDPEIPIDRILPEAPIVQLIADGEEMEGIVKNLMRSDADYFVFGEARDGVALNTALRVAERGGRRLKMTYHITNPLDFPLAVGHEIALKYGGDAKMHALRAALGFDFLIHLVSEHGVKIVKDIYEVRGDAATQTIDITNLRGDQKCSIRL